MIADEYLNKVLEAQNLNEEGKELRELRRHRQDVESLLCSKFGTSPRIRYGGSKAKGTMILESYDLDIHCYFARDDTMPGDSLEEIYENVAKALEATYFVDRKRSALRLTSKRGSTRDLDLHIDVVPGRFIDGDDGDVFLHQNEGSKERLQTNLDVHIEHIRDSGVTDAIRLAKLWKVRNGLLQVKTFILELLIVDLLKKHKKAGLERQIEIVFTAFRDEISDLSVIDPANSNNDLSATLEEARNGLSNTAERTLRAVEQSGWEAVFGSIEDGSDEKRQRLQSIAISIPASSAAKPWWM